MGRFALRNMHLYSYFLSFPDTKGVKNDVSKCCLPGVDLQDKDAWRAGLRHSLVLPAPSNGTRREINHPHLKYEDRYGIWDLDTEVVKIIETLLVSVKDPFTSHIDRLVTCSRLFI